MNARQRKERGAFYTPDDVAQTLVRWAIRAETDRLLDPACGDGRFLRLHPNCVGVEQDSETTHALHARVPAALIHQGDFFAWAFATQERFECAAGNPPFIRYQKFAGETREAALRVCARQGACLSALASSWAPFLVAAASLLKPGGRMAFVVPAEIGHAPYAKPVLEYLTGRFDRVHILAIQSKLFPDLSEDCWLLFADGFFGSTDHIRLSSVRLFRCMDSPPRTSIRISLDSWRKWNCRLRSFLLSPDVRDFYESVAGESDALRLHDLAKVGIGYVTGDNDFFHLRPSEARRYGIPGRLLHPTVRSGRELMGREIALSDVRQWRRNDEQKFLLRLGRGSCVTNPVRRYLDSDRGQKARDSYKCRHRDPWYSVPDVTVPDAFLSYMSGRGPALVANRAGCTGTNSVHMVHLKAAARLADLERLWHSPLTPLSCEIEGHPLGGGMLKLEPREAGRLLLTPRGFSRRAETDLIQSGIETMRRWRHCG